MRSTSPRRAGSGKATPNSTSTTPLARTDEVKSARSRGASGSAQSAEPALTFGDHDASDANEGNAKQGAVRVLVRIRPQLPNDKGSAVCVHALPKGRVQIQIPPGTSTNGSSAETGPSIMSFDMTCDGSTSQLEFFERSGIKTMLNAALDGYAATVFAYGQTGSGKTFTMSGVDEKIDKKNNKNHIATSTAAAVTNDSQSPDQTGLVPRSFHYLTEEIARREAAKPGLQYVLRASYMELYNEQLRDLLNSSADELMIRQRATPGSDVASFFVQGLTVVNCELGAADLHAVATEGHKNRTVASHNMNEDSSRSHSILTVYVECRYQEQSDESDMEANDSKGGDGGVQWVRYGKISFIDLAGSENLKTSGITGGEHLKETANINKSLFALGSVISTLGDISTGKKNSLGGRALTMMIACASPALSSVEETRRTLAYAATTRNITNKPEIAVDPRTKLLLRFKEECERLKTENTALRQFIAQHGLQLPLELVASESAATAQSTSGGSTPGGSTPEGTLTPPGSNASGTSDSTAVAVAGFPSAVGLQEGGLVSSAYAYSSGNTSITTTGLQIGSVLTSAQAEALMRDNALLRSRIGNLLSAFANGESLSDQLMNSQSTGNLMRSSSISSMSSDITADTLATEDLFSRAQSSLIDYDSMINKKASANNDKFILRMFNERLQKNVTRLQKREAELLAHAKTLQDQVAALQSAIVRSGSDVPQALMASIVIPPSQAQPATPRTPRTPSNDKSHFSFTETASSPPPPGFPATPSVPLPPIGFPNLSPTAQPVIASRPHGSGRRMGSGVVPPSPSLSSGGGGPSIRTVIPGLSEPLPPSRSSDGFSVGAALVGAIPEAPVVSRGHSATRVTESTRPTRLAGELVIGTSSSSMSASHLGRSK